MYFLNETEDCVRQNPWQVAAPDEHCILQSVAVVYQAMSMESEEG
jgi:hypothetical protein